MNEEPIRATGGEQPLDRRTFLKGVLGVTAAAGFPSFFTKSARAADLASTPDRPNILLIITDQQRAPHWFPHQDILDGFLPAQARIRKGAVNFTSHYAVATKCSPSRGALLTGLYPHQTGFIENQRGKAPELNIGFPTWGSALRDVGYNTAWYGKWHLSGGDTLEPYGFDGGTYPSPNGGTQVGTNGDGKIVDQFIEWFDTSATKGPWATTVSLLNPHDIGSHPHGTREYFAENPYPNLVTAVPGNYETPDQVAQSKPRLQIAYQGAANETLGSPTTEEERQSAWVDVNNAYIAYQRVVDAQIGRVLAKLDTLPNVRDNTIIIFTSDHGEFGGSHGLRGKGGSVYEEGINVPFYVNDPRSRLTKSTELPRTQLTSCVDLFPLLLTIGTGSNAWRAEPKFAHIAGRADMAEILLHPYAKGRDFILHTSDQPYLEAASTLAAAPIPVPYHVIGYRTKEAKLGLYNDWLPGTNQLKPDNQDVELYDYSTPEGRLEIGNDVKTKPALCQKLNDDLQNRIIPNELRQSLPARLQPVQEAAYNDYYQWRLIAPKTLKSDSTDL